MLFKSQTNLAGVEENPTEKAVYYKVRLLDETGRVFETSCNKEIYDLALNIPRFSRVMVEVDVIQGKYNFTKLTAIKEVKQQ